MSDLGWVKLWRRSMDSAVWADPNLWRTWCCCLMLANHKDQWVKIEGLASPILVKPGQFITGRFEFHKAMYPKKKKSNPAPITTWRWLKTLENLENLIIQTNSRFSLIIIVNWDTYQHADFQNDQANDQPVISRRSAGDHKQECKEKKEEPRSAFFPLQSRYKNQDLLNQIFSALASTRKSNKVSDSVLIAQLQKWERYPVEQVEAGIRIYLDKDYAGQGKREAYLLGIIRNQQPEERTSESTGSPALDQYYAERDQ